MVRRRSLLALTLVAAGCSAPPAQAEVGRLVQVQVIDRTLGGEPLATHHHRGSAYVAGRPGNRYALRLVNRTGARVLVVLSVDGINAITGETAHPGQTGYVLGPWQAAEITGWRKSDAEAAAFYFTALPDSYAARTDRPDHVGVIGAAVFRERVPQPPPLQHEPVPFPGSRSESERRLQGPAGTSADAARAASPAPAEPMADASKRLAAPAVRERLGTGHGEREYAPVSHTSFERASARPAELVQIRYDSHANLVAAGVIPRWPPQREPRPFPGYVPDPG